MIYGKTHHPVLVKKINLGIWSLRDEIEALILEKLNELGVTDPANLTPEQLENVKDFYRTKENNQNSNVLKFVQKVEANTPPIAEELSTKIEETAQGMGDDEIAKEMTAALAEEKAAKAQENSETPPAVDTAPQDTVTQENPETPAVELAAEPSGEDDIEKEMAAALAEEKAAKEKEKSASLSSEIAAVLPKVDKETSPFRKKPKLLESSKQSSGVMLLSDINMDEILLFSKLPFNYGQNVVIEFLIPQYFVLGAEIISCNRYNLKSRIINPTRPEYRIRAKFNFQTVGERTLLRSFLKSIEPDIPSTKKKKAEVSDSGGDDDLSELGI